MRRLIGRLHKDERGASAIIIAMMMTVLLVVAALVIDVGATAARNAQLQDAADAAALALAQQCYESDATNEIQGCDPVVRAKAAEIAGEFATATLNDGVANVIGTPAFNLHTVTVTLASPQQALFSWAAGADGSTAHASATAQWNQPAVALPLAMSSCTLPDPGSGTVFMGTGLYTGVSDLLSNLLDVPLLGPLLTGGGSKPGYLSDILACGTNVLAGGWLATPGSGCTYDPNLLTFLNSTLTKVVPMSECATVLQGLVGKRVIVPVYDNATVQVLGSVLGSAPVTRYAEIVVTGYEFQGVLGSGPPLTYYAPGATSPSCARSAAEFLGVDGGVLGGLLDNPLLGGLLNAALGPVLTLVLDCQGLQGQIVNNNLTPEQASDLLVPYRLIA